MCRREHKKTVLVKKALMILASIPSLAVLPTTVFLLVVFSIFLPAVEAHDLGYGKTFKDVQNKPPNLEPSQSKVDYRKLQIKLQQVVEQSKALSARVSQYDALIEMGKRQLEQAEIDQALFAFSSAQRLIPIMADSYRWIAEALLEQGQYLHAEKFALHFVSVTSSEDSVEGWRLLGEIYHEKNEKDLMLASYRNLLFSQGPKPLKHWLLAINALQSVKAYQESLDAVDRGLGQYPANTELIKLKIQLLKEQGNMAYARLVVWQWLSSDLNSSVAWHEIAKIQSAFGADDLEQDSLKQARLKQARLKQATGPSQTTISQSF